MGTSMPGISGEHACCRKTLERKTLRSYATAVLAVFLACLCCSLPLIPLMLGLSAGSSLLTLTKYHALFEILGGVIVFGSVIYIWHEHKSTEKSVFKSKQFWTCLLFTFAMYAGMSFVLKQVVAPKLEAGSGQGSIHEHQ